MRAISNEQLKVILENHIHWLNEDCNGWEKIQADLRGANLRGADLRDADLRDADLRDADLRDADLCNADLRDANLCNADLRGANLYNANLYNANLYNANLRGANLRGANIRGADLYNADLRGAKNIPFIPMSCPDTGCFFGFKKAKVETSCGYYECIIKLFVPSDAKRSSATGRKCRCDKAVVVDIEIIGYYEKEPIAILRCFSDYDENFTYEIRKIVSVDNFDEDRFNECAPGIHFFINKQEAIDY